MIKRFIAYYKPHIALFTFDMLSAVIVNNKSFLPLDSKGYNERIYI